ncbi:hypothetical protein HYQ46_001448 [Verticillium longisporum]|nr:hypothetical protein HYQ46_001448 [Verticillium longisporum]
MFLIYVEFCHEYRPPLIHCLSGTTTNLLDMVEGRCHSPQLLGEGPASQPILVLLYRVFDLDNLIDPLVFGEAQVILLRDGIGDKSGPLSAPRTWTCLENMG